MVAGSCVRHPPILTHRGTVAAGRASHRHGKQPPGCACPHPPQQRRRRGGRRPGRHRCSRRRRRPVRPARRGWRRSRPARPCASGTSTTRSGRWVRTAWVVPRRRDVRRAVGGTGRCHSRRPSDAVANGPTGTNTQETGVDEPDVAKTDGQDRRTGARPGGGRHRRHRPCPARAGGLDAPPRPGRRWAPARRRARAAHGDPAGRHRGLRLRIRDGRQHEHRPVRPRRHRPRDPAAGRAHHLVRVGAVDAAVRRHGAPGHLDGAARAAVRAPPPRGLPRRGDGTQPRDRARRRHRHLAPVGARRRHQPACGRLCRDLPPGDVLDRTMPRPWVSSRCTRATTPPSPRSRSPAAARRCTPPRTGSTCGPRTSASRSADRWTCRRAVRPPSVVPHTDVHAFAIDGDETRYVASGRVDGEARDSWSFDEHDGHLRIALSWPVRELVRLPDDSRLVGRAPGGQRDRRARRAGRPAGAGRAAARPRTQRGDPVGALVRRPGGPGHLPADRPAVHRGRRRPDPASRARGAAPARLLLLPAPDRRRPAAGPRHGRLDRHARAGGGRQGGGVRPPRHLAGPRARRGRPGRQHLAAGGQRPARLHLAAGRRGCGDGDHAARGGGGRGQAGHAPRRRRRERHDARAARSGRVGAARPAPATTAGWPWWATGSS